MATLDELLKKRKASKVKADLVRLRLFGSLITDLNPRLPSDELTAKDGESRVSRWVALGLILLFIIAMVYLTLGYDIINVLVEIIHL